MTRDLLWSVFSMSMSILWSKVFVGGKQLILPVRQTTVNPSNVHCSNCRSDDLIQKMMQSIELLSHDVKYHIQLSQLNRNIVSNDLPHNPALEQLPVYTVEQLLKFNESLQDKQVMAATCTSLQVVGGERCCRHNLKNYE
ncbi:hypothetical protein RN001_009607 [Aquatica leii]|uniref:Uncharacterized protein n=1 Tax=Aquatica leii TaxID=1421715 RepID=A0AAN7P8Z4_9COLE|nr:hypothetical protein RN001_009607 [Aquatica leii]